MDGYSLSESLHGRGINIRYLGKLATMLAAVPQLQYLHRIAVSELILRATKHIFTSYMQVLNNIFQNFDHFHYQCYISYLKLCLNDYFFEVIKCICFTRELN